MSFSPLNVGIVGTGIFARDDHLPAYQKNPEHFKVSAVFNRTRSKALEFAKLAEVPDEKVYSTVDEIMNDPKIDYIDALLPVQFNVQTLQKAIEHKKPIIIEKPIAATMEQAREFVRISENTDIPVAIAENWLCLSFVQEAKKHIKRIGRIVGFSHNFTGPNSKGGKYKATSWRQHAEHLGGSLSDGGVHQIAILTDLLGDFDSVSAFTTKVDTNDQMPDAVFAVIKLKSGAIGNYTYGTRFGATKKTITLKVYGQEGSVLLELNNRDEPVIRVNIGDSKENASEEEVYTVKQDNTYGVGAEMLNFYEAVTKKDKNLVRATPRIAFHHLACIDAFLKSSDDNGNNVKVETI
ncbi:similar to Saccharomyces cerevisiae YMR315W Protein with NADP(H) oxidoreductase activity [Maudiozyma saulgeensis]|uniref:Similar to Saccharomyces cerevisiae YMR315W Protein with NADP(H) oxidoreductase activity n=1 Tax=Maudiozyma saulgeensis TaxID=1789683 RepID=A0A1X7R6R4_9SACH|nr:similar to Saccharomyces cerevisiae YMR315W Protein with NADP(H) oxidoreductase activity [Kazachstania saulgeensis]